jgi:hypothetical protein
MTLCNCFECGKTFERYRISAKRAANPQFCSKTCQAATRNKRGKDNITKRFYERVNVGSPHECWEWKARRDLNGYGLIDIGGRPNLAHRVSFFITNGYECENVCHACDNPPCCNPKHLWAGNPKLNVTDMVLKGRWRGGPPLCGSLNPASKLTEQQVILIIKSTESYKKLSEQFNVSTTAIRHIKTRQNWKYLKVS